MRPILVEMTEESNRFSLETAGRLLTLAGVLLPAVGFGARWLGFGLLIRKTPTLEAAAAASLTQLAATGFVFLAFLIPVLVELIGDPSTWMKKFVDRPQISKKVRKAIAGTALAVLVSWGILFAPGWPANLLLLLFGILTALVGSLVRRSAPRGRLAFSRLLPIVAVAGVGAVTVVALAGVPGVPLGRYEFSSSSLTDGRYLALGRTDSLTYLYSCENLSMVATRSSDVLKVHYLRLDYPTPSLWDVLFGDARIEGVGLSRWCMSKAVSPA